MRVDDGVYLISTESLAYTVLSGNMTSLSHLPSDL